MTAVLPTPLPVLGDESARQQVAPPRRPVPAVA